MARQVTLRDVASAAGVSISTVSRVLDDRLPPSRTATADRVRQLAAELGYHKDLTASALRRSSTGSIGVLVPRLSDTVMALFFEAIYEQATKRGQFAMVSICEDDPAIEQHSAEELLARRVDGLVLAAARLGDELPQTLRRRGVPHVLALRTEGSSPASVGDDELGGYLATRHLIDLGHRKIAALPGPEFTSTANGRLAGYHRAMDEASLPVSPGWVHRSGFGAGSGQAAAQIVLAGHPEVTAIFAANDDLAFGAMAAATRTGRRIPDDVSVVGYNDTPLAAKLPVPLTSVRVPFDVIAGHALELLDTFDPAVAGAVMTATPTLIPRASSRRI